MTSTRFDRTVDEWCDLYCNTAAGSPCDVVVDSAINGPVEFSQAWESAEFSGGRPVGAILYALCGCVPLNPFAPVLAWCTGRVSDWSLFCCAPTIGARKFNKRVIDGDIVLPRI